MIYSSIYSIEAAKEFGDYYRMSLDLVLGLNTSDPSLINRVLNTNVRAYRKSIYMQSIIGTLIGTEDFLMGENETHSFNR